MTVYFEDFQPGHVFELGTVEVTEDEIVEFAERYDPQPFHTDPATAAASPYGGLIASGWQTCSLYMRQLYDGLIHDSSSQGSTGMEELRWLAPVRPGDRLAATYTVEDVADSSSDTRRGTVMFRAEFTNQDGVLVLRMRGRGLYGRRPADEASSDPMPTPEEYQAAGLYDPDEHRDTGRLELLDWLAENGLTIDDMVDALHRDAIAATMGDRRLVAGERLDRATAIERSGLPPDDFDRASTALGFVAIDGAPDDDVRYVEAEIAAFAEFAAMADLFTRDSSLDLLRVVGSSIGRIAEAAVSLFLADVESPHLLAGLNELALARKAYEATGLVDDLARNFEPVFRRQILQAVERTRRATIDEVERFHYRYAVGFVDLVGFTPLSGDMPPRELAAFMAEFEGRAHDVATEHGARVVKLIGDEVMFVTTDPSAACRAGRALMEAFVDTAEGCTPRGGLAYGLVVLRGGDYYGPVVNLASRLVDEAVPLELLVTDELAAAATACEFEPAGRRMVKGFDRPVAVRSLLTS